MDKKQVRQEVLSNRKSMKPEDVELKSNKITETLLKSDFFAAAANIMAYIDFRNEVKTKKIIEESIAANKSIIIPISIPDTRELVLSQLIDYERELMPGTYGILEPKEEFIRKVSADVIDLVLIPGVAFDRRGYRVGYGAGYYDRFLSNVRSSVPRVALAFDLQIVPKVYEDDFDIAVDYIITESEIIDCKLYRKP